MSRNQIRSLAAVVLGQVLAMGAAWKLGADPIVMKATYTVRNDRAVKIPVRDGKRLSADLFRPEAEGRFPALVMYHPYRKDDLGRGAAGDHYYFAERGFVAVRLDARGTGSSEGINTDEYRLQEQLDGYDVVEWLARQPWSNGSVGMWGTSYSGFTSLQVASHRPPHLKAVVPLFATDDRYTDDCHYDRGGNMRMYYDLGTYGGRMVAMNSLPPQPELAGPKWAEMWKERLENNQPYLLEWVKHQVDGPYWQNGSLRPDYSRVQVPVFLIGGWHDGYTNAMLRTYVNLKGPKKILMGPWVHRQPNVSVPGPRIDWMNEATRFFAHWLRNEDTGIMKEPPLQVYMQETYKPDRRVDLIPGSWRGDSAFPSSGATESVFYLEEEGRLSRSQSGTPRKDFDEFDYLPTVGLQNAYWSAGSIHFYMADDQRQDEARSLVYTSPVFEQETHILGWPKVILKASSSAKAAAFVARLAAVSPDGHSTLIVDGAMNGTRRNSLTNPEPMKPGEIYELKIPMAPTGWIIRRGDRLRLSISSGDFPNLWPTPFKARNRVYRGGSHVSRVVLPVVRKSEAPAPEFLPPPTLRTIVTPGPGAVEPLQQVIFDQLRNAATVVFRGGNSNVLDQNMGSTFGHSEFRCSASDDDPAKASIVGTHKLAFRRDDGVIEVNAESSIRSTETDFHVTVNIHVTRNGLPFFQKQWLLTEPRRLL
ncbi:MAG: CocE/NonD family hydrolase [Bryobacteraceae bacterium]